MYSIMVIVWSVSFVVLMFFIASAVLKFLWNTTMPDIFRLVTITYWQAFRLLIIASLLFGPGTYLKVAA